MGNGELNRSVEFVANLPWFRNFSPRTNLTRLDGLTLRDFP